MRYEVLVGLKPEVLDPQARAIRDSLNKDFNNCIEDVVVEKKFEITLSSKTNSENESYELIEKIAKTYLANPVSESFQIRAVK